MRRGHDTLRNNVRPFDSELLDHPDTGTDLGLLQHHEPRSLSRCRLQGIHQIRLQLVDPRNRRNECPRASVDEFLSDSLVADLPSPARFGSDAFRFQNPLAIRSKSVLERKFLKRASFPLHLLFNCQYMFARLVGNGWRKTRVFCSRYVEIKSTKEGRAVRKRAGGCGRSRKSATGPRRAKRMATKSFLRSCASKRASCFSFAIALLDSMMGVSRDTLRSRAEGSEASAFGMHQADAGSDAYDRDFALSLLSQEQDALYEIEEALKRVDAGTYGICEMSGKPIPHARLEAIPFARFTVECQTQIEKQKKALRVRQPVTSLFGLTDEEGGEGEEEDTITDSKE